MSEKFLLEFTIDELKTMDGKDGRSLYVLIDGNVYDLTRYDHPGGKEVFEQNSDTYEDLYSEFLSIGHSSTAARIMKKYHIGKLKDEEEY